MIDTCGHNVRRAAGLARCGVPVKYGLVGDSGVVYDRSCGRHRTKLGTVADCDHLGPLTVLPIGETIEATELHADDPIHARALWLRDFRPVEAQAVAPGDRVAYWATDVFQLAAVGDVQTALVYRVRVAEPCDGMVTIEHAGGATEADELTEVWTRKDSDA